MILKEILYKIIVKALFFLKGYGCFAPKAYLLRYYAQGCKGDGLGSIRPTDSFYRTFS